MTANLSVGDNVNVDIYKPNKGTFPVGKIGGLFCKLFIPTRVGRIEYGCTCLCVITKVNEKSVEATVLEVVRSTAANNFEISKTLKDTIRYHENDNPKYKKNRPFLDKLEALNSGNTITNKEKRKKSKSK